MHSARTLIPWSAHNADGTVCLKDGGLLVGFRVTSIDNHGLPDSALMAQRAALHHMMAGLGDGFWFWTTYLRRPSSGYLPRREGSVPAVQVMDSERRAYFEHGGALDSEVYVWLAFFSGDLEDRVTNWLFSSSAKRHAHAAHTLANFSEKARAFEAGLSDHVQSVTRLSGADLEAALESCLSFQYIAPGAPPASPFLADRILGATFDAVNLTLDGEPVRVVTLSAIPQTTPRSLELLRALPYPFLMSTRTECISAESARSAFRSLRANISAKGQGLIGVWLDGAGNNLDPDVQEMMDQASEEMRSLADGAVHCNLTISLVFRGPDAHDFASEAVNILRRDGIKVRIEGMGTPGALLSCLPGKRDVGVRVMPLRLIHAIPFWPLMIDAGSRWHTPGAYLAGRRTDGTMRVFCSSLLASKSSTTAEHGLGIGPTDAGKSTLLALMGLSWLTHSKSRTIILDKDRSCRSAVLACGGTFREDFGIQPLRACNQYSLKWLLSALRFVERSTTVEERKALWQALQDMKATEQPDDRRIARFLSYLPTKPLRDALTPFAQGGAHGELLDGVADPRAITRIQAWEMSRITESPVMSLGFDALLPQVEALFDGTPTLLLIDEAWDLLARSILKDYIAKWLRTLRKKRVSVWLFTQNMSDVMNHPDLRDVLTQQTQHHILLPNSGAIEGRETGEGTYAAYRGLGLSERAVELIAGSTPRREYLIRSGPSVDVVDFCIGPQTLALVGRSGIQHQQLLDRMTEPDGTLHLTEWLDAAA